MRFTPWRQAQPGSRRRALRLPSPSMLVALTALVFAAGGTAFAASQLPARSVGAKQLKANAVERSKIKNNAVNGSKVAADTLTGLDINESTLAKVPAASNADTAASATSATHAASSGALDKLVYKSASGSAPANSGDSATAGCDPSQHVTGGGVKVDDPINAYIVDEYPDAGSTAWTGRVGNAGTSAVGFTVYAICAPSGA